jgi:hypothetical protein
LFGACSLKGRNEAIHKFRDHSVETIRSIEVHHRNRADGRIRDALVHSRTLARLGGRQ